MTIDIERLKTDAAYWDSVATEGAKYYCTEAGGFHAHQTARSCCIPRPTTQAAPEWDGEVGDWVEHCKHGDWIATRVIGFDGPLPVCSHGEGKYYGVPRSMIRPLRTKEQRQREELSDLITDNIKVDYTDGNFYIDDDKAVNAILSRYNLEPKL